MPKKFEISTNLSKGFDIFSYESLHSHLPFVYNNCVKLAQSGELKKDIKDSMKCIKEIEKSLRRKHFSQGYRTNPQVEINCLSRIIQKTSVRLRVDFVDYMVLKNPNVDRDIQQRLKSASSKIKTLGKKQKLKTPCLMPFISDTRSNMKDELDDYVIRNRLTLGLIDYIQRLMIVKSQRLKCCEYCENWFYANRTNVKTCSDRCRNNKSSKNEIGRAKRKKYMRVYRKEGPQKRGAYKSSN